MFGIGDVVDLQLVGPATTDVVVGIEGDVSVTGIGHHRVATRKMPRHRQLPRIMGARDIVNVHGSAGADKEHIVVRIDGLDIDAQLHVLEGHRTGLRRIADIDDLQRGMIHRIEAIAHDGETGHGTALSVASAAGCPHPVASTRTTGRQKQHGPGDHRNLNYLFHRSTYFN